MTSTTRRFLAACLITCASPCAVLAQDTKGDPPGDADKQPIDQPSLRDNAQRGPAADWSVTLEPALWWVSPGGKTSLPSSSGVTGDKVRLERLNLDNPRFSPAGALTLNADRWRFSFNGAAYSENLNTIADSSFRLGDVVAAPGDALRTKFEYSSFEITAGYRFLSHDFKESSETPENAAEVTLNMYAIAGARLTDLKIGIDKGTGSSTSEQFYVEAIGGARAELQIIRDFSMNLQVTGGGYGDSDRYAASFDIAVSFGWRPVENIGVEIGWRQILHNMQDGSGSKEFTYDGAMAGLFTSILIRF